MEEDRLAWPQHSLLSSNVPTSTSMLSNEEDLLDFELESETFNRQNQQMSAPLKCAEKVRHQSRGEDSASEKDYSFIANVEVVGGSSSVDMAFFPDASRSAGESSSNEEDVIVVETLDGDNSRTDRKTRKNRKKKK